MTEPRNWVDLSMQVATLDAERRQRSKVDPVYKTICRIVYPFVRTEALAEISRKHPVEYNEQFNFFNSDLQTKIELSRMYALEYAYYLADWYKVCVDEVYLAGIQDNPNREITSWLRMRRAQGLL